ncbi:hypothetical protein ACFT38_41055 [Streptomyces sp. NPDC056975]|uniref:hypothetical protein n=1 Tax=Streptomyces sp. NPDC056975 TaxID=3345985 RepID=UPI003643B4DC
MQENIDEASDLDVPDVEHYGDGPLTEAQRAAMRALARIFWDQAKLLKEARTGVDQFGPDQLAKLSDDVVNALRGISVNIEITEKRGRPLSDEAWVERNMTKWEKAEGAFRAGVRRVMETPPRRRRVLGR